MHNLHYGRRFELLPTGAASVLDLPLGTLVDVFSDPHVRWLVHEKLTGALYLASTFPPDPSLGRVPPDPSLALALVEMQVLWVAAVVRATRHRARPICFAIAAAPAGYLAMTIIYDIWTYYPRHILAFNLALLVTGLVVHLACGANGLRSAHGGNESSGSGGTSAPARSSRSAHSSNDSITNG